jgi:hypothetical protein
MDPSYVDSDEEAEAMAKAMGFSSFGNQGSTKKRKFNPSTDAVVEGQELAAIHKGGKNGQGSGGNQIPLGKSRVFGGGPIQNADMIVLDDEEEVNEEDEGPAYLDTSLPPPLEQVPEAEAEGPTYIDTSLPPPGEEARAAQERIDAILENASITVEPPDANGMRTIHVSAPGRGISQYLTALQSGPPPAPPNVASLMQSPESVMGNQRPGQRGQKNTLWYVNYYDPSFNENPWSRLEKAKGLQAKGTWVEREGQVA